MEHFYWIAFKVWKQALFFLFVLVVMETEIKCNYIYKKHEAF